MATGFLVTLSIVAFTSSLAYAYDPSPLQDFCVAVNDPKHAVFMNGRVCKDPKLATADDFFTSGLDAIGTAAFPELSMSVNVADVNRIPGMNTLGLTVVRTELGPGGLIPPHTHPRSCEFILVVRGTVYSGFVAVDPRNLGKTRLFEKTLKAGDVFVIPQGLIHFTHNVGAGNATLFTAFNSQNAGFITLANELFGSDPAVSEDVLSKAFRIDKESVQHIQAKFSSVG
ncbi:PREDICTED: germin-like protein subfamily 1 member 17 [Ipomoea nil]|uniref:germin-like protein subfamily 1 member 17 n=1 Tax=Ipomoea nil TaxID=35883 RepID=UPI000900EFD8|nr:PREDICTED: germin-like protein subfamily 1 member 17 [Ipomoea nil]